MYKTISVQNHTYQKLNALANKLKKTKSQLVDDLVQHYIEQTQADEKSALRSFNTSVKRLSTKIKLPKGTKINTNNLDQAFEVLVDKEQKQAK